MGMLLWLYFQKDYLMPPVRIFALCFLTFFLAVVKTNMKGLTE